MSVRRARGKGMPSACAVIPAQAGIQLTLCVNLCNKSKNYTSRLCRLDTARPRYDELPHRYAAPPFFSANAVKDGECPGEKFYPRHHLRWSPSPRGWNHHPSTRRQRLWVAILSEGGELAKPRIQGLSSIPVRGEP